MRRHAEPHSFEERLNAHKLRLESELARLPGGQQRDSIAARIEQLRAAAEMYAFLSLPESVG